MRRWLYLLPVVVFGLMAAGGVALGLALWADSYISNPWQLYLGFGVFTAVGVAAAGWIPAIVQVQRDFQDKLGLALGIVSSGVGVGMLVVVPLTQWLMDAYGWRIAFRILAAVCVLWIVTFIMGAWIYMKYRVAIRIPIERAGYWKTQGFFELKEHAATIGLALLPAYWLFWKYAREPEYDSVRKWLTFVLAVFCWFNFLVGHVVNNVRGFGS